MPSTYTDRLGFEKQEPGENFNQWGERLNNALDLTDEAIAGRATISLTGNHTLTNTLNEANQARKAALIFTDGGLSAVPTVTIPAKERIYYVENRGATYAITFTAGGTTGSVPAGATCWVICDGTNVKVFDPLNVAMDTAGVVRFNLAQALTDPQKVQGRANIAAPAVTKLREKTHALSYFGADIGDEIADALEDAFDYAAENEQGLELLLDAGEYYSERLATHTVPASTRHKLTISGANARATRINVDTASNTDGNVIALLGENETAVFKYNFRDFTVLTNGVGVGKAFNISKTEGGQRHERELIVTNVETRGSAVTTPAFNYDWFVNGVHRPLFQNIVTDGPFGPTVNQAAYDPYQPDDWPPFAKQASMDLSGCYGPIIERSHLWGGKYGVYQAPTGGSVLEGEGLGIFETVIVFVKTGVYRETSGFEPGLNIQGGHINYRDYGVHVNGCKTGDIRGVVFYNEDKDDQSGATNPADVYVQKGYDINICDNYMLGGAGNTDRISVLVEDVTTGYNGFRIIGNRMEGNGGPAPIKFTNYQPAIIHSNRIDGFATKSTLLGSDKQSYQRLAARRATYGSGVGSTGGDSLGFVGEELSTLVGPKYAGLFVEDLVRACFSIATGDSGKAQQFFGKASNKTRFGFQYDASVDALDFLVNEVASIRFHGTGNIEFLTSNRGPIVKAPNGTTYRLGVDNSGNFVGTLIS